MADLSINLDGKRDTYRQQRMYSSIIGTNLLSRIIKHFGYEILFQFGFNSNIVDRMVKKGLLGGEIDILAAIWKNRENLSVKYMKRWEFELFVWLLPRYTELAYLKPVCMLSLFRPASKGLKNIVNTSYEDVIFSAKSNNRWLADRTKLFDALIWFICELHDQQQKLPVDEFADVLTHDFASDHTDIQTAPYQLYQYFNSLQIDQAKHQSCQIQRKPGLSTSLPVLYAEIRKRFSQQGIGDIKEYCEKNCGGNILTYHNLKYVNFVQHMKRRHYGSTLPNVFLQYFRNLCSKKPRQPQK